MDVQLIARILGPVLLRETEIGRKALKAANEILPMDFHFSGDITGEQADQKIDDLPPEWRAVLLQTDVEDDKYLEKLKREIKTARVKKAVTKHLPKSWVAIAMALTLVIIAMVVVSTYAVVTFNGGEGDTETLSMVIRTLMTILTEALK